MKNGYGQEALCSHLMHLWRCLMVFAFTANALIAAETGSIYGTVLNGETGEPIEQANVEVVATTRGDVTDKDGQFEISGLQPGEYWVRGSVIGYEMQELKVTVKPGEKYKIDFELAATTINLPGVEIQSERIWKKLLTKANAVGVEHMRAKEITTIPGALDDPTRAAMLYGGVASASDFNGYMVVRGGSPEENQVIVDGMVIPNPYRFRLALGGGMSAVNPNTIQDVYLHLGGFSAEYGNALSSVLEVESRMGDRDKFHVQGSVNVVDANALVEGPLPNAVGSYLFSARRTYYDILLNQLSDSDGTFPFYHEFAGKIDLFPSRNDRVTLSASRTREGADLTEEIAKDGGLSEQVTAYVGSVFWQRTFGEQWKFETILSYYNDDTHYRGFAIDTTVLSYDDFGEPDSLQIEERDLESVDSEEINLTIAEHVQYKLGDETWLKSGVSYSRIPARMDYVSADFNFLLAKIETPGDFEFDKIYRYYAAYMETSTKASEKLHLRVGARYDYSSLIHEGELSPRLSIWYQADGKTKIEGSWGVFHQYPNPMSVYTRNIPINLTQNLKNLSAERAIHQILSIQRDIGLSYFAKLQLYHKALDRLMLPQDEINYKPVNNGRGYSNGFELVFEKRRDESSRFNGLFTYAYGRAKYRSAESDKWFRLKYDRRHAATLFLNSRLSRRWNLSMIGQLASGLPYTDVVAVVNHLSYSGFNWVTFLRGDKNAASFPTYKRLDARLSYQPGTGRRGWSFYLDVINLTNEKNIYEITWEKKTTTREGQRAVKRKIFMLPMLFSFGINFQI